MSTESERSTPASSGFSAGFCAGQLEALGWKCYSPTDQAGRAEYLRCPPNELAQGLIDEYRETHQEYLLANADCDVLRQAIQLLLPIPEPGIRNGQGVIREAPVETPAQASPTEGLSEVQASAFRVGSNVWINCEARPPEEPAPWQQRHL